MGKSAPER